MNDSIEARIIITNENRTEVRELLRNIGIVVEKRGDIGDVIHYGHSGDGSGYVSYMEPVSGESGTWKMKRIHTRLTPEYYGFPPISIVDA